MRADPIYQLKNVPLYEAIYGKNLISLGGLEAIDNMFSDLNLKKMKALDVGFGIGGVAFYLAKKYHIEIKGIEVHAWMVEYATTHAPKEIAHLLEFAIYNQAGEIPFKDESFDLVYSKGVLNHVLDKYSLFQQINRVLKINGLFVIADWIYPEAIQNYTSPLVCETEASYREVLEKAGFININFRDDSSIFAVYVKKIIENIVTQQEFLKKEYGQKFFSEILSDQQQLLADIIHKRKFAIRIVAYK